MDRLENSLDFLLARTCREHYRATERRLESVSLHRGQPRLLFVLSKQDGLKHSELAKRLEVTAATISNMVKRLEQGGFVVRRRDPEDERVSRVYLTNAGQAIIDGIKTAMQQMDEIAFAGFSESEKVQMRDFLLRIQANLMETAV